MLARNYILLSALLINSCNRSIVLLDYLTGIDLYLFKYAGQPAGRGPCSETGWTI